MRSVIFNGVDIATAVPEAIVTNVEYPLLGTIRDIYEDLPGWEGSRLFDEHPGDRLVLLDIALVGTSVATRRASVRALADWADSNARQRLIVDDEPTVFWDAKLSSAPNVREWLLKGEAQLEFRTGPYVKDLTLSTASWTAAAASAHNFNVPDDLEARPVIEVNANAAMPDGFQLTTNGATLIYGSSVANNDTLTISGISYTVSSGANTDTELEGTFNPNALMMALVSGEFPLLQPGTNTVQIDATIGGASDITVTWRRRRR